MTPAEQKLVDDFLHGWLAIAVEAHDKTAEAANIAGMNSHFVPHNAYWRNAISCIQWLLTNVRNRQRWKAIQELQAKAAERV